MQENLKRTIGIFGLATAVVNITVGTGIFVLPALIAEKTGAAAILCFFICGLLILLIALCFAEVGSRVNTSGGTYVYIEKAFGPFAGFLANNIFWFGSCILSDAAVANAICDILSSFVPALNTAVFRAGFFALLFGGLALLNIRGSKYGLRFIMFTTFGKLIPIIMIIGFGMPHVIPANLEWKRVPGIGDIGVSSLALFYAFLGIETAVTNSGEIKNPGKTVPWGILSGLTFVLILYITIQLITQGILGDQLVSFKEAPISQVSKIIFGKVGITLVIAGTVIAGLGGLSGEVLAIPRVLFAGARNGIFPRFLSAVHPRFFTPHVAIIVYTSLGFIIATLGAFRQLVILASAATLLIYLGVVLATIKLRFRKTDVPVEGFTIPGGIVIPCIATLFIIWMLSNLSRQELTGSCIFIAIISLVYFLMILLKKNKTMQNKMDG